jgi:HAD superfamily hydrolase (TIGR01509 family)
MNTGFDAVCWDHDGLLVDSEAFFFAATREVFAEAGVELSASFWSGEYLSKATTTTAVGIALGLALARMESIVTERNRRYRAMLEVRTPFRPAVRETLEALSMRVPMALVTGSGRADIDLMHRRTGLLGLFRFVITREDYPEAKPAPDGYLEAAKRLGLPPQRCLAVEDSARGLGAAIAAGMRCVVVPSDLTRSQRFEGAHAVETSVAAVPGYVRATGAR